MAEMLIKYWYLAPLLALVAIIVAVRASDTVKKIALGVIAFAALEALATWSVSSTPEKDGFILLVSMTLAIFAGVYHMSILESVHAWFKRHPVKIVLFGLLATWLALLPPEQRVNVIAQAIAIPILASLFFPSFAKGAMSFLFGKKKSDGHGH